MTDNADAGRVTWVKHPDFPQPLESKRVRNERATQRQAEAGRAELLHPSDAKGG